MQELTVVCAGFVVERLNIEGHESYMHPNYSGRNMFGKVCTGIVTDAPPALIGVYIEKYNQTVSDQCKCKVPTRSDNMGLSMIYY